VTSPASRRAPHLSVRFSLGALRAPGLPPLVATSVATGFAWGAMSFGLSALAVLLGSRQSSGLLLAVLSAGSIAGGLVYGAVTWRGELIDRYRGLLVACAAATTPLLFVGTVLLALPAALVAGLPLAPLYAASYVLTGRVAPRDALTEAFTWTSAAFALGVALGTGLSAVATASAGVRAAFALACLAPIAGWLVTPLIRDRRATAESPQPG